jgi:hypothetical protein
MKKHMESDVAFKVTWVTDIFKDQATTPREAAQEAWDMIRRADSIASVFSVTDATGKTFEIDLEDGWRTPSGEERAAFDAREAAAQAAVAAPVAAATRTVAVSDLNVIYRALLLLTSGEERDADAGEGCAVAEALCDAADDTEAGMRIYDEVWPEGEETPAEPVAAGRDIRQDGISIVWRWEDVQSVRDDLTEDQCVEVLEEVRRRHDASVGINWDLLQDNADTMFPRKKEDQQ